MISALTGLLTFPFVPTGGTRWYNLLAYLHHRCRWRLQYRADCLLHIREWILSIEKIGPDCFLCLEWTDCGRLPSSQAHSLTYHQTRCVLAPRPPPRSCLYPLSLVAVNTVIVVLSFEIQYASMLDHRSSRGRLFMVNVQS